MRNWLAPPGDPWRRLVTAGWLLLCAVPFAFVIRFGVDCPHADEWVQVPALVGERPLGPWLIERHNEHLYPLPRLVWWGLFHAGGGHFQAGMFFTAWALGASAWLLLRAVRQLRGRTHPADLLIPAVLLHEGHAETLLAGYNLCFALVALFVGLAAWVMVALDGNRWRLPLLGVIAVSLAACGGGGLVFAVPLAVWLAWGCLKAWRSAWPTALLLLVLAFYAGYYGLTMPASANKPGMNVAATLLTVGTFLGGGVGATGPVGVAVWVPASIVVVALVILAVVRGRTVGLLALLTGALLVGCSIAVSRWNFEGEVGLSSRYGVFAALVPALAWVLLARRDDRLTSAAGWVTLLAAVVVAFFATPHAETYGVIEKYRLRAVGEDVRKGLSTEQLAEKHVTGVLAPVSDEVTRRWLQDGLESLKRSRLGPFK